MNGGSSSSVSENSVFYCSAVAAMAELPNSPEGNRKKKHKRKERDHRSEEPTITDFEPIEVEKKKKEVENEHVDEETPSEKRKEKKTEDQGEVGNGVTRVIEQVENEHIDEDKQSQKRKKMKKDEIGVTKAEENSDASASSSGRFTVSMAVAGSIVDNAQSFALASRLAGQIARAAAIFRIDEIVVFDDGEEGSRVPKWSEDESETSGTFLTRLLRFMETPQYLRQSLFPRHSSLGFAGSLPPLDVPHQARKHEWIPYREGAVTTSEPPPSGGGCCVNVGLYKDVVVRQKLDPGTRVTVKMGDTRPEPGEVRIHEVVPKSEPREKGHYWGYTVRHASCLSTVISDSPFPKGYDYIIGTSEHGEKIRSADLMLPKFEHILIVFGGVAGLEESKELDKTIQVNDVRQLFNIYLNVCPGQGSRTIRTEEAILISLQYLQDPLMRALGLSFSSWCS